NRIQELDEQVKADFAEVLNQYKRRADLVPQLIKVVQAAADFEKDTLAEITKARSSVGGLQATPELINNKEAFEKFQTLQNNLGGALQRLMVVSERYPELKATEGFRDLQVQLEGTENRIAVARRRFIKSVQGYNTYIRKFPAVIWAKIFDYEVKPSFTMDNADSIQKMDSDISKPPEMDFKK
ncbi:MAG: LemA family protein, partial [Leptospiraceae bacterium]|nr:LemA family protein [Leptospiraceae bacterium]